MLNPYIAGAPVTEASMFFGRQDVFDWIERSLAGKYVDHILVIHGQRRVGKTSVLKQIPNFLPNRYVQVYLDFQGRAETTLDRFLWWVAREIARTLHTRLGLDIPRPDQDAFTQDSEYFHTRFLPGLKPLLDDRVLLLTFDEFDTLSQAGTIDGLGKSLTNYLRQLFDMEGINFIFSIGSSGKKLENMQAAYTEFFKAALYKKISFLSAEDSRQLITRPVEGVLAYDPSAVERIYQITSGHPYYTQLTCHELFSDCQKTDKKLITLEDVDAVLPDVVERGTVNLKFVWDEAGDLEKWALACLAQDDRRLDFNSLADELRRQKVRFSDPDLNSALLHLREKDVLAGDNRFIVDLMRLWLRTNRPLDRVREELVEVNPIANRFIEIGDEYRERGASQDALHSYAQALSADPGNLKAQVSIANIHLAGKDYQQAAIAFEKAVQIDPEDIRARSGFCEAAFALGGEAQSRGEDDAALGHYRRVVAVNPEHRDARQRLSRILCGQAEAALAQGRHEAALKTFNAALEYTPDDEALEARYEQVCEQVKDRVLADLLDKAEAEQERGEWEKAIAHLEDYLRFEHGDAEVVARLAEARRQQHLSQLAALKAKAQELGKAERWQAAAEAWQSYLDLGPEDRGEAEAALQAAQRYQGLDERYRSGQDALRAKDYPGAIRLFQGVIAGEPAYKDAARLLSEAIVAERKHRPLWSSPWIWAALIVAVLAVLVGVFGGDVLGYLTLRVDRPPATPVGALVATAPATQATSTPTIPPTRAATSTATPPAATPTPPPTATALPQWISDFGRPVLSYINSKEPDFADDFSEARPEWRLTNWDGKALRYADYVTDEALILEIEPNIGLSLKSNLLDAPDFALEYDYIEELGGSANPHINFRESDQGAYRFFFSTIGQPWNWAVFKIMPEDETLLQEYSQAIGYRKLFKVLLIVKGDQIAVYLNDQPAGYVQDSTFTDASITLVFGGGSAPSRVRLDNFKYWELEGELTPAWVTDFAQPVLNTISAAEPDFEDDFSEARPEWQLTTWTAETGEETLRYADYVTDGTFRLEIEPGRTFVLGADLLNRPDFALQFDLFLGTGAFRVDTGPRFRESDQGSYVLRMYSQQGSWNWQMLKQTWGVTERLDRGYSEGIGSNVFFRVLLIAKGDQMAVYINDQPAGYVQDSTFTDGELSLEWISASPDPVQMIVDNLKYWELKDENAPAWVADFAQPILDEIETRAPDIEEDFSEPDPGWVMSRRIGDTTARGVDIADYIQDGALKLDLEKNAVYQFRGDFVDGFDQTSDFALQYDFTAQAGTGSKDMQFAFRRNEFFDLWLLTGSRTWWIKNEVDSAYDKYGEYPEYASYQVLILSLGDQVAVFLNGKPLGYATAPNYQDPDLVNLFTFTNFDNPSKATLDNLKFWKLDAP